MKKTILQMMTTVVLLWSVFFANNHFAEQTTVVAAQEADGVRLPVIMYHSILKDSGRAGQYVLSPAVLRADLTALKERGYETVTVSDLLAYVQQGTPLPEKPVMITFDDGYYNNYLYAYPILQELNMKAVISVIGSQTALYSESGQTNAYWSHLTLDQLREMVAAGTIELQNHSYNLHVYGARRGCVRTRGEDAQTYKQFLTADTMQAQNLLNEAGLPIPQCYAYPFGSSSKESEEILKGMGFLCTLGCEERVNVVTRDPNCLYQLGRFNRASGQSTDAFLKKVLA